MAVDNGYCSDYQENFTLLFIQIVARDICGAWGLWYPSVPDVLSLPLVFLQVMKFEATSQGLLGPLGHGDHQDPKEIVVWWLGLCLHCIMIRWLLNGRMEDPWVLRDPMEDHLAQAALTAAP